MECGGRVRHERRHRFGWVRCHMAPACSKQHTADSARPDGIRERFPAKAVWRASPFPPHSMPAPPMCSQCMECGGRVRHERRHRFGWVRRHMAPACSKQHTADSARPAGIRERFPAKAVWRASPFPPHSMPAPPMCSQCMECGGRVRHERRHRFGWVRRHMAPACSKQHTADSARPAGIKERSPAKAVWRCASHRTPCFHATGTLRPQDRTRHFFTPG
jgi:ssDNA-binding Zn-finger/Zn-ribbon topoisomerase 1